MWDCPAEARPYKPNEKKLDSRTISHYYVEYSGALSFTIPLLGHFSRRVVFGFLRKWSLRGKIRLETLSTIAIQEANPE